MKSQVISPTPEQLRRQAEDMLKRAEQLEKTGATKDALKKALVPALRELMQAKHRAQLAVDELVDSVADLPTWFVPADEKQKPTSAFFAGAIVVFDKTWRGEHFSYIDRVELEAKGRASMALAEFAAGKFLSPVSPAQSPEVIIPEAGFAALAEAESRIWPLEVGLVFNQVEGAEDLELSQQNKLKAHINQLWLERMPTSEIITVAGGLVGSMKGGAHA